MKARKLGKPSQIWLPGLYALEVVLEEKKEHFLHVVREKSDRKLQQKVKFCKHGSCFFRETVMEAQLGAC